MNKGLAAGIVIVLVAGMSIGYFLLPMLFPIQADQSPRQTFFCTQKSSFNPSLTSEAITDFTLNFSTETSDSVLLSFTCRLTLVPDSADSAYYYFWFHFYIDGIIINPNYAAHVRDTTNTTNTYSYCVSYRYDKTDFSAGPHNASIWLQTSSNTLDHTSPELRVLVISAQIY